jgi:hypothetical protein
VISEALCGRLTARRPAFAVALGQVLLEVRQCVLLRRVLAKHQRGDNEEVMQRAVHGQSLPEQFTPTKPREENRAAPG